jgi:type I restriction enzyme M protein
MNINVSEKSNFIWKIADLLRGDYKQSEYGDVILPFTVLCRLDSVLAPTKEAVLDVNRTCKFKNKAPFLMKATKTKSVPEGYRFYNTSEFTFAKLKNDATNIADNLTDYIKGFSENARTILESFDIYSQIARLDRANLLYLIVTKFVDDIDLHPDRVKNNEMGYIFEELIRKFSEMSNETAGEHFTPREVIRLMVSMLFTPDMGLICEPGFMAKLYDPAAGTGGMLSAGIEKAAEFNEGAMIQVYGQELNEKTYAICKSDTLIKGDGYQNIHLGNSFTEDALPREKFHYMLCNPPFGVEWKKYEKFIRDESEDKGFAGRFGAGLPRVSDGSLLFLQHMISKMMEYDPKADGVTGCRLGIVLNGSPLFTGDAGSGESEIRKWIIENGWLETIIALPDQLFYNTGILTYVWIVTNRKKGIRKGRIQLIDGTSFFDRMRKPLGEKRKMLNETHIDELTKIYGNFVDGEFCKIFDEDDFAYWKVTVERPLRLNFQASPERIERIREQTAFANLAKSRKRKPEEIAKEVVEGEKQQEAILTAIATIDGSVLSKNRAEFAKLLQKALKKAGLDVKAPLMKAILAGLSEKDETAKICTDAKGNPEPDTDLRDTEQIPFTRKVSEKEAIDDYIEREVKPYAPDAWVDYSKTKKGYELPFTRHFYKYEELGNAEETLLEIQSLGERIQSGINRLFAEEV